MNKDGNLSEKKYEDEYIKETITGGSPGLKLAVRRAFKTGWGLAEKYFSKWKDPNVELPEDDIEVLCKTDDRNVPYVVLKHNKCGWWIRFDGGWGKPNFNIIGWQPIYK